MLSCLAWDSVYFRVGGVCQKQDFYYFLMGLIVFKGFMFDLGPRLITSGTPVTINRPIHRAFLGSLNQNVLLVRIYT